MTITSSAIPNALIFEPKELSNRLDIFFGSFRRCVFANATCIALGYEQDNYSSTAKGALNSLQVQIKQPQGKPVHMLRGARFDAVVDIQKQNPSVGQWEELELSEDCCRQRWVSIEFARAFVALPRSADFLYKNDDLLDIQSRALHSFDRHLAIDWCREKWYRCFRAITLQAFLSNSLN